MDLLVLENKPCQFRNKETVGEWDQSGPVLNPGGDAIYRLSKSVVGFLPRSERFFSGVLRFSLSSKSNMLANAARSGDWNKQLRCVTTKIIYITYFKELRQKL